MSLRAGLCLSVFANGLCGWVLAAGPKHMPTAISVAACQNEAALAHVKGPLTTRIDGVHCGWVRWS